MLLNTEYGKFLNTQDWDYFTTLTYKWDVKQNRTYMDRLVDNIKKTGLSLLYCRISFLFTTPVLVSISKKYIPFP